MDNNKANPNQDNYGTWLILLGLLLIVWRVAPMVKRAYYNITHNKQIMMTFWITVWSIVAVALLIAYVCIAKRVKKWKQERAILGETPDAVYSGRTDKGKAVYIKPSQRCMHTQIIGTTNAGKTESVILSWAIQDIMQGRGLILIDGKADRSLLDKLYAYVVLNNREKDFKLFSLSSLEESTPFNPLLGGTPEEVAERVFNSFEFENAYYRAVQYEVFAQLLRILHKLKKPATFYLIYQMIRDPNVVHTMAQETNDPMLVSWSEEYMSLETKDRREQTSGLSAAVGQFALGECSKLFNTSYQGIDLVEALAKQQIIYFQLPVLLSPFLGRATGKLVLQCFQSAIAKRHSFGGKPPFYSCFLDDFTEYLYPGFVSILNKSRSANVGIVFAHQALGDIKTLGDAVANSILTNANLKIFMRGNDPESAEYFSKVLGTQIAVKQTERVKRGFFNEVKTGDISTREVEEFIVHPNVFKRSLGVGEAHMVVPHAKGSKTIKVQFDKCDDLPAQELPRVTVTLEHPLPNSNDTNVAKHYVKIEEDKK